MLIHEPAIGFTSCAVALDQFPLVVSEKTHVQASQADPLSSVVDALKGILAKLSPADQAAVSGFLTSELGSPAVSEKRRRPAPSTAETKAN